MVNNYCRGGKGVYHIPLRRRLPKKVTFHLRIEGWEGTNQGALLSLRPGERSSVVEIGEGWQAAENIQKACCYAPIICLVCLCRALLPFPRLHLTVSPSPSRC